jgi:hypothetical protein
MNQISNFFYLVSGPVIVVMLTIIYTALRKKHPSDSLNSKISNNLSEYEKEMRDRYKL